MIFRRLSRLLQILALAGSAILACTVARGAQTAPGATPRPNIVFVLLDDVRFDDVINHPFAKLPNFQRLVDEGASFQRMFTSAPLCSPSRYAILTGRYASRSRRAAEMSVHRSKDSDPPLAHLTLNGNAWIVKGTRTVAHAFQQVR